MWEAFLDALSLSVTALIMAFAVLILIMLAMYASAAVFSRQEAPAATPRQPAAAPAAPAIHAADADAQHVAAIVAALEAAEVEIPAGGRVRIEKVSRRN